VNDGGNGDVIGHCSETREGKRKKKAESRERRSVGRTLKSMEVGGEERKKII